MIVSRQNPKIVAIGGGTGLPILLEGIKAYTEYLTAIVVVSDDGGSSGILRKEHGIIPPGDFRNCLVSMSNKNALLTKLFQYRFDSGEGLKNHSLGNLLISAMTQITGTFENALIEASKILEVKGTIAAASTMDIDLSAKLSNGTIIYGESNITNSKEKIETVNLIPPDPKANPIAVNAIKNSDLILIGPGSLYTSVIPNLMIPEINNALKNSPALKFYICNVATEKGETNGYTVSDHIKAVHKHAGQNIFDVAVVNNNAIKSCPEEIYKSVDFGSIVKNISIEKEDLVDIRIPTQHDPIKLSRFIMDIFNKHTMSQK